MKTTMKKTGKRMIIGLLPIIVMALINSCSSNSPENKEEQVGFTIIGQVNSGKNAYLLKKENGEYIPIDTISINNGQFIFKGKVLLPEFQYIGFDSVENYIGFFVENSKIQVTASLDSLDNAIITGSNSHDEYTKFKGELAKYDKELEIVYHNYKQAENDSEKLLMDKYETEYDSIENVQTNYINNYVQSNSNTVLAPYLTLRYLIYTLSLPDLKKMISNFDPVIQNSVYTTKLKERADILSKVEVGQPSTDFTLNDTAGNPLALSSLQGKYLLVDFWASWCGPCRKENPNVVKLYKTYQPLGFEILGVSLDKDKDKWIKAIKHDKLDWYHVSDLQGWKNSAAKIYAVYSIPHTILLDPQGKIIAKGLRGNELAEKLKEIFNATK